MHLSIASPEDISIYVHVPFCSRKCDYCHFYTIPIKEKFEELFMNGLQFEWERYKSDLEEKKLKSIYFGGGTPILLGARNIEKILEWIGRKFSLNNVEISLEANPENISYSMMKNYSDMGIKRVSIGVQSFSNKLLKLLGRSHDSLQAVDAVLSTFEAGISNISIDLMYDLPKQTLKDWENTLDTAKRLPIAHLSLYNLTIEPHTVFYKKRNAISKNLPNEKNSKKMLTRAIEFLNSIGLKQYEISSFAKNKRYSIHNTGYWLGRSFLGLGPSAFSYWKKARFKNIANINRYHQYLKEKNTAKDFEERLHFKNRIRELFTLQLRLNSGINLSYFEKRHGKLEEETKKTILQLKDEGLLKDLKGKISLTKQGILFYDSIAAELI